MLSPEPMRHLALVILSADLEAATRAIAHVGVLHLLDVRQVAEDVMAVRPYDTGAQLARLERLAHTLDGVSSGLGIGPTPLAPPATRIDLGALEARAAALATAVEALRRVTVEGEENVTRLRNLLRTLRSLEPLGVPLEDVQRLRYVYLASGLLPARNLARLRESLTRIVAVILPADAPTADQRLLITALCARQDREVLDRALRSAQFEPLAVPARLSGTPADAIAQVGRELTAAEHALAAGAQERATLAQQRLAEAQSMRARLESERLLLTARGLMGYSERTTLISGWVPAVLMRTLDQAIRTATGDRCVMQWSEPHDVEGVRLGRIPVPILLHNPVLIRPYERLLRGYGLPRYGEVEPTAVIALGFLIMFGFMFGDVGQGAVLFAIGYFVYRRMFRYRDYAVILMECGVFGAGFGFLYGSVFGVEDWLPALWLRPLDDMTTLMKTAILFGIAFLSLGMSLNVVNAFRRGDPAALWERNGLLATLAYWTAAGLLIRHLMAGPGTLALGTDALWLALPLALIFLKEPVLTVIKGAREHRWPDLSEACALAVASAVEVLDTLVSTISNTATFIRLAAFALSHAGLFVATFSVADAVAKAGAGTLGAAVTIVLGNAIIIALEGMIVCIQSIRLEYYEFFSKFYSGGGEEYRPLRFTAALPHS